MPNYSGMWTSRQQLQAIGAGYWPGLAVPDAQFNYVSMLLPGNGTDNAQNKTFVDSSNNAFVVARNGDVTQGTFSPYGPDWSYYFNSSSDSVRFPASTQYVNNGTVDLTIEFWTYVTTSGYWYVCDQGTGNAAAIAINFATAGAGYIYWYSGTASAYLLQVTGISLPTNTWTHFAFVRNGSTTRVYVNGVSVGSSTNSTAYGVNNTFDLGRWSGGSTYNFPGYISNFRYVNGTAVYTGNFTPPTAPLTAITNTVLLTAQSSYFRDASINNFTATANGTTSVQRFNPFGEPSPYSASAIGGSAYFDGAGDYLSYVNSTIVTPNGTESFTIECWVYPTNLNAYNCVYSAGWPVQIYVTAAGTAEIYISSTDAATGYFISAQTGPASSIKLNQWAHVALVRNGTAFTVYVNGVAGTTTTYSNSVFASTSAVNIGRFGPSNVYPFTGYISNFRVVRGTAVYTAAFTPPSSPVIAISGTQALLNMTNAAIIDNAEISLLDTQGSAKISTTQSKFGGSSMFFNGSTDRLVALANPALTLLADFTIEMWVYPTAVTTYAVLFDVSLNGTAGANMTEAWLYPSGSGCTFNFYAVGTQRITGATVIALNTWTHIALTRSGTTTRSFVNGVLDQTYSTAYTFNPTSSYPWCIGDRPAGAGSSNYPYSGYIDDLRITNGVARYTSAFTPPSAAFPTYGPV